MGNYRFAVMCNYYFGKIKNPEQVSDSYCGIWLKYSTFISNYENEKEIKPGLYIYFIVANYSIIFFL